MTTIVGGVMPDGTIVMAADTRVSDDDNNQYWESLVTPKISVRNDIIYGLAGDTHITDHILYLWEPPKMAFEDPLLLMHTVMLPSLNEHVGDIEGTWHMIIGLKGTLFVVLDKAVIHDGRTWYTAIGSGGAYALGYLYGKKPAVRTVQNAIEVAAFHDHATGSGSMLARL